jgi:hypothetical protein
VTITSDRAGMIYAAPGTNLGQRQQPDVRRYNVRDWNYGRRTTWALKLTAVSVRLLHDRAVRPILPEYAKRAFDRYVSLIGAYPFGKMFVAGEPQPPWSRRKTTDPTATSPQMAFGCSQVGVWFYAAVGSNQATEPFADEALLGS